MNPLSHVASWLAPPANVEAADDSKILALFREWMISARHAEQDEDDVNKVCSGCELTDEIVDKIAEIPAMGLVGFVIKTYLCLNGIEGGSYKDPCVLWKSSTDLEDSVLSDAARFVNRTGAAGGALF
jgi:hypothetical protein